MAGVFYLPGFFDAHAGRSPALLLLRTFSRLTPQA